MDRKAEQYWKDHQLWRFIKFGIYYNEKIGANDFVGRVEHNGWKFFVSCDDCISYIAPTGEKRIFYLLLKYEQRKLSNVL